MSTLQTDTNRPAAPTSERPKYKGKTGAKILH